MSVEILSAGSNGLLNRFWSCGKGFALTFNLRDFGVAPLGLRVNLCGCELLAMLVVWLFKVLIGGLFSILMGFTGAASVYILLFRIASSMRLYSC